MCNEKQLFSLNLVCAAAYYIGAYIGALFVLPPGGLSPIWPATGIALTALLLYGKKVLPGIFLGALLAQIGSFFDSASAENLTDSLIIGLVLSIASCLQALVGFWLIRHFVGKQDLLIKDSHIIKFLLLGGPIACVVTASFATAIMGYTKIIAANNFLSHWITWWIGDSMGVLIFTPLLLIFFAKPRDLWQSRCNYVAYPIAMFLALVLIIFHYTEQAEEQRLQGIFNQQTSLLESEFRHELNSHVAVTKILKSFFESSTVVTQEDFQQFSKTLLKQHASVQALEWIPLISKQQRSSFETFWQRPVLIHELDVTHKKVKAGQRDSYFPITFIEPLFGNDSLLGFDVAMDSATLQALQNAQKTGQPVATFAIYDARKIVIYSPVYDRKQALRGFVASLFEVGSEIAEAASKTPNLQMRVKVVDANKVLYSNFPAKLPPKINDINLYKQTFINVASRSWQISYLPSEDFIHQHQSWQRWWLLSSCLLFTGLTGMSLLMLSGRTLRTEEIVQVRTQALHNEVSQRENRSKIFHSLVVSTPLPDVLNLIVKTIEDEDPEISCSILLLDQDEKHLKLGATGRLPEFYRHAIDGMAIGEGIASCATTAFLGQRTIDENINKSPHWEKLLPLAQQAGLSACWSEPIISSDNKVMGTFALYYPSVKAPNADELQKIEEFAKLASLAIEKKNTEEKILHLAFYDTLTQLPNRRLLNDRLTKELAGVDRHQGFGALMFLDLDHFKTLNDSLGHHIGDELLIQVAIRLKECVRDEDTVARLGGDEFVVLQTAASSKSPEQASDCALTIAKRIQKALFIPYSLQGYEHHVTSSIGITLFGKDNKEIDAIFKQADTAMYAAKDKGRNTFSFYNNQMQHHADERLALERDLIVALNTQQFELYYQPQYDTEGLLVSAEALLRWVHPEKGLVATSDFIRACEESGLILAIGEWTLRAACQQLLKWPSLPSISINIGTRQFHQPGFVQQLADILAEYQLSPHSLILELTEKTITKDNAASIEKMNALQQLGVRIAIDNFGTGYSSVAHLKNLPINQIKIDQRFIREINLDSSSPVIVETMIMIAKQLKLHIVAEGVETLEQVKLLQGMGCNIYQGYYFGKPLTAAEFQQLFKAETVT